MPQRMTMYRFNDELESMVYTEEVTMTEEDLKNDAAREWLHKKDLELGLSKFGSLLLSDYIELANYKFKDVV